MRAVPEHDGELVAASIERPDLFRALFERHAYAVLRYAGVRVGPTVAEDVASETFLIAFERRHRFDCKQPSARPWLYGVATNVIRRRGESEQRWLRSVREPHAAGEQLPVALDVGALAARLDAGRLGARLRSALSTLDRKERELIVLLAVEGLSYQELALATGTRVGTVRSRLNRARRRLRAELGSDAPQMLGIPHCPEGAPAPRGDRT